MIKRIFSYVTAVLLTAVFCFPSFALDYYASDEKGKTDIPEYVASITISQEDVSVPKTGEKNTYQLTPDGNLTLVDDYSQLESENSSKVQQKQFLTVTTKSGNTFYIIVDRDGNTDNVHFLNMVDEADLLALLGDDIQETETTTESTTKEESTVEAEKDPENKENSKGGLTLVILLVIAGVGFAVYWFRFKDNGSKPKQATENIDSYEDYEETEDEDMYDIYSGSEIEEGDENV